MYSKEKIKLFIAKKNCEVIGFSLTLLQRGVLDVMMVGFNYSMQTETDFSYFNLTFYTPIKWAIENGVEKIYYRWSMEKIKLDRGCKPEETYSFTKYHNILLRALIRNLVKNPFFNYLRQVYLSSFRLPVARWLVFRFLNCACDKLDYARSQDR